MLPSPLQLDILPPSDFPTMLAISFLRGNCDNAADLKSGEYDIG